MQHYTPPWSGSKPVGGIAANCAYLLDGNIWDELPCNSPQTECLHVLPVGPLSVGVGKYRRPDLTHKKIKPICLILIPKFTFIINFICKSKHSPHSFICLLVQSVNHLICEGCLFCTATSQLSNAAKKACNNSTSINQLNWRYTKSC